MISAVPDIDVVEIYLVKKHDIEYIDALGDRSCMNCRVPMYIIFPFNKCPHCTLKIVNNIVSETWKRCGKTIIVFPHFFHV